MPISYSHNIGVTVNLFGLKSDINVHHFHLNLFIVCEIQALFPSSKGNAPILRMNVSRSLSSLFFYCTPPSSLCQGVLGYLMLISAPPLAPFPSCLSLVSVYLPFSGGVQGVPLRSLCAWLRIATLGIGNGSISSWNPHRSPLTLFLSPPFQL